MFSVMLTVFISSIHDHLAVKDDSVKNLNAEILFVMLIVATNLESMVVRLLQNGSPWPGPASPSYRRHVWGEKSLDDTRRNRTEHFPEAYRHDER